MSDSISKANLKTLINDWKWEYFRWSRRRSTYILIYIKMAFFVLLFAILKFWQYFFMFYDNTIGN